ncbi:eukaryotic translation initiation factor 3 subunit K-like [Oscarella lobularis]|uniref:eukaryotic translation initiation factor 3 subunit K-like n=1 Tax=Oscarella lobularis TaxID=121494 RepID=UPI00331437A9
MSESSVQIEHLLSSIDRYNPDNVDILEAYALEQAKTGVYNLKANLAVLKLYQFNPPLFKPEMVSLILLKAITNLPNPDYQLCFSLIHDSHQQDESLKVIAELSRLLETCQFQQFWTVLKENPDLTKEIEGFEDSIRKFICHVVSLTWQTIRRETLTKLLGEISDPEVENFAKARGWKTTGETIFIANQEATVKPKNIVEKIQYDNVAGVMMIGNTN